MTMKDLKVLSTIVCDDVRHEDNGKEILIGVYSSDIRVARFPATLRLVFWMQALLEKAGHIRLEIRLFGPNDVPLTTAHVDLEVPRAGSMGIIQVGPQPIQLESQGSLKLEIRDHPDGEWEEAKSIPVVRGDIPGKNVPSTAVSASPK